LNFDVHDGDVDAVQAMLKEHPGYQQSFETRRIACM
jgi:hypothetical protein